MWVFRSNRAEALAGALATRVAEGASDPLAAEVIVVQSRGMERWLSLTLADALGVWAGARFPFPRAFLEAVMAQVLDAGDLPRFSREDVSWWIAAALARAQESPQLAPVARYLGDDRTGRKLVSLAAHVADAFDQYAVFRPELVLGWERGEGEDWQAWLWRQLVTELRDRAGTASPLSVHAAGRRDDFVRRFRALGELPPGLPRRVSLFGIATLPPLYLEVLTVLAERVDVGLFLLSPSREYVAEVRSPREVLRALQRGKGLDRAALHLGDDNPLVTRLGRLNRELEQVLGQVADYQEPAGDLFVDPGTDSLLHALQHDVLHLRHRRGAPGALRGEGGQVDAASLPLPIADDDRSVEIHCCHGPWREVEVLNARLHALFDADPTLEPHEVIVMAPRIDLYAPLIEAVFGGEDGGGTRIPYRIADRAPVDTSPVVRVVLDLLGILSGRFTLSELAMLLEAEGVRARFQLEAVDVPRLVELIEAAGARWGVDAEDRVACGALPTPQNTWRFALQRLLLGYAMGDEETAPFGGVAPLGGLRSGDPELLGRLAQLLSRLFDWRTRWRSPRTIADHVAALLALLDELLEVPASASGELQVVRDIAAAMGQAAATAGFAVQLPLAVFRELLLARLPEAGASVGFLASGVTFSALLPMRSVPFRVVCLLGMNDGEFPRRSRRLSFDYLAEQPRPGDRSLRHEDENLFLEVLLSARERLIISYAGRSMHDDLLRPPSMVVAELIDVIDAGFSPPPVADGGPAPLGVGTRRVVHHPIQRWSRPRGDGSAAPLAHDVAPMAPRASTRGGPSPFLRGPLPLSEDPALTLEQLVEGLASPARTLCRRLGLRLEQRALVLSDREPIEVDALERARLGATLLERSLAEGLSDLGGDAAWELERGRGRLPSGAVGRAVFAEVLGEINAFERVVAAQGAGERHPAQPFLLEIGGRRLTGALFELRRGAQLFARYRREGQGLELEAWVRHLLLQVIAAEPGRPPLPRRTLLVARPESGAGAVAVGFRELPATVARTRLLELVELVSLAERAPVPFFPRAARCYLTTLQQSGDGKQRADAAERALVAARAELHGEPRLGRAGEAEEPHARRVFAGIDPLAPQYRPWPATAAPDALVVPGFVELSVRVFAPLLAAREVSAVDVGLAPEEAM